MGPDDSSENKDNKTSAEKEEKVGETKTVKTESISASMTQNI